MSHAAEYRLINQAVAEQRSCWWDGSQARRTVPYFLQPIHQQALEKVALDQGE